MFLIRTLHKWFGLILGLQFVLWSISGAMMALLDHHKVSGEPSVREPAAAIAPAEPLTLARLSQAVGPIQGLKLRPLATVVGEAMTPAGSWSIAARRSVDDKAADRRLQRFGNVPVARSRPATSRPIAAAAALASGVRRQGADDALLSTTTGEVLSAATRRLWTSSDDPHHGLHQARELNHSRPSRWRAVHYPQR